MLSVSQKLLSNAKKLVVIWVLLLLLLTPATAIAQDYNCGAYGAGAYGNQDCSGSTTNGDLSDTGLNVWLLRALSAALIIAAVLLVIKTLKQRKKSK